MGFSRQKYWNGVPLPSRNQCYIDAFHEKATLYNFSNSGLEVDDVNITSRQLPQGFVMMQHRTCHCTEQWGTYFQGTLQAGSVLTEKDDLLHCCCCFSVAQLCRPLCNPMDCSMPSFPVHHLPEFAQTHVHWVNDAIQPSHPLSSPSPPALNLSQHQGLFQWVNSFLQVAKVLKLQHQSLQ